MAIGTGINSQVRGKFANSVYYLQTNNKGTKEQVSRMYQPAVRNPKSYNQAVQRMRLQPIQSCYAAWKPIITRAFEGVKYGEPSHQKFLSLNMADFNGAYVKKGALGATPSPLIISVGSLTMITTTFATEVGANYAGISSLRVSGTSTYTTVAKLSQALLDNNASLKEGDQLTFVFAGKPVSNDFSLTGLTFDSVSVVLDTKNNAHNGDFQGFERDGLWYLSCMPGSLTHVLDLYAAGFILSRQSNTGTHLRSTCRLACSWRMNDFLTDSAFYEAVMSYMTPQSIIETWPTDPDIPSNVVRTTFMLTAQKQWFRNPWSGDTAAPEVFGYITPTGEIGLFKFTATVPDAGRIAMPVNRFGQEVSLMNGESVYHLQIDTDNVLTMEYDTWLHNR